MTVKAVLLDLDGTVVKLRYRYTEAKMEVFRLLEANGVPRRILEPKRSLYENLRQVERYLKTRGIPEEYERLLRLSLRVAERYEVEAALEAEPVEGVYETLKRLRSMGLRLALITNNGSKPTKLTLSKLRLDGFFHLVVTRDHVGSMKPDPKPIEYALSRLGVDRRTAVMVGDSPIDVKAALASGIVPIAVASGVGSVKALRETGARYVIDQITELPALLERIRGNHVLGCGFRTSPGI